MTNVPATFFEHQVAACGHMGLTPARQDLGGLPHHPPGGFVK